MASSLLNTSLTKEENAFAKSSRFQTVKTNTINISEQTLTKLSDFDKIVLKGSGKEHHNFGSTFGRFTYYPKVQSHGMVSPSSYSIPGTIGPHKTY
jgi:hypothetical protein